MKEEMLEKYRCMNDDELIEEVKSTYERFSTIGCFGVGDLLLYEVMLRELERRGYALAETVEVFRMEEPAGDDESRKALGN
jgi:hypothetical protein